MSETIVDAAAAISRIRSASNALQTTPLHVPADGEIFRFGANAKAPNCVGRSCGGVLDPRVLKYYAGPELLPSDAAEPLAFVVRFDSWLRNNGNCHGGQGILQRRQASARISAHRHSVYIRSCL